LQNGEGLIRIYKIDQNLEDVIEAADYFKMSAEQGYSTGQDYYEACLATRRGVSKNMAEAVRYYKMSAMAEGLIRI
jgi:TPR repeat protein